MVVPELPVKTLAVTVRSLARVSPGVRNVCDQIAPYTTWWSEQNQTAFHSEGRRWVAIGDSLAIGIGASAPDKSYVGQGLAALNDRSSDQPWHAINLSMSGARVRDALDRQLPALREILSTGPVDIVTVGIGNNDVLWTRAGDEFRASMTELLAGLPRQSITSGVIVLEVTGVSVRARSANKLIREQSAANGLTAISPWHQAGPPMPERQSTDRFHPNDLGYSLMSVPIANSIGALATAGH